VSVTALSVSGLALISTCRSVPRLKSVLARRCMLLPRSSPNWI